MQDEMEDSKEFIGKFENKFENKFDSKFENNNVGKFESSERFMIHKSNSSNLEQDIKLAFEVKKYPSLYDKRDHGYKRNDPSMESWGLVANACDWIPNAEEACRLFEVLKKRYSKKKMDFRRANYFANSSELMRKTKEELDKYQFMSWMEPHIRHRTVKLGKDNGTDESYDPDDENDINVIDTHDVVLANSVNRQSELGKRKIIPLNEQSQIPTQIPISDRIPIVYPIAVRERDENDDMIDKDDTYVIVSSSEPLMTTCPRTVPTIEPITPCIRTVNCVSNYNDRRSLENGISSCSKKTCKQPSIDYGKSSLWKGSYPNYSPLRVSSDYYEPTTTSLSTNQNANTIYQGKLLKDEDELFSEMILNEIRKLDGKEKCLAKHEIVNILFNAQLKQYEKKKESEYSRS